MTVGKAWIPGVEKQMLIYLFPQCTGLRLSEIFPHRPRILLRSRKVYAIGSDVEISSWRTSIRGSVREGSVRRVQDPESMGRIVSEITYPRAPEPSTDFSLSSQRSLERSN